MVDHRTGVLSGFDGIISYIYLKYVFYKMFNLILASLLFGLLAIGSLLMTYVLFVLLNQANANEESSLNALIMTQITLLYNKTMQIMSDFIEKITKDVLTFIDAIQANAVRILYFFIFVTLLATYSENKVDVLSGLDKVWRCALSPLINNVLMNLLIVFRMMYDLVVPIYNFYQLVVTQVVSGTASTVIKCDLISFFDTIRLIFNIFIAQFNSVISWTGMSGEMSLNNNIFANEFNITQIVWNTQLVLIKQENISKCVCDGLTDSISMAIIIINQREIAHVVNHLFNVPVSLLQEFALLSPPFLKYPRFVKTINHVTKAVYNLGKYFDNVFLQVTQRILHLFSDTYNLQGIPPEVIFTPIARLANSAILLGYTFVKVATHVIMPKPSFFQNSDYMMQVTSIELAVEQYTLAHKAFTNTAVYAFQIADVYAKRAIKKDLAFPEFKQLKCDGMYKNFYYNIGCAQFMTFVSPVHVFHLGYKLFNELLWKSLITQEEDMLQTLQRYDGITFPKKSTTYNSIRLQRDPNYVNDDVVYITCDYRNSISFDMTAGECKCNEVYDYEGIVVTSSHPYGKTRYDLQCGQPNLQSDVFNFINQITDYGSQGIGNSVQRIIRVQERATLELIQTGIKFLLTFNEFISDSKTYFHTKRNCGYGLTSPQLRHWFNFTYDPNPSLTFTQKIDKFDVSTCNGAVKYVNGKCRSIDNAIKSLLCEITSYKTSTVCSGTNQAGCTCNYKLALDGDSPCGCIASYPDDEITSDGQYFTNNKLRLFQDASQHYCNTFWLEGVYTEVLSVADTYEKALASINLQQKCNARQLKMYYFDRYSCRVEWSENAICSFDLTLTASVNLVVNQMRAISMGLVDIINLDLSRLKITFGERLCDIQKIAAGLSSTLVNFIPGLRYTLREGATKIIYQNFAFPILIADVVNTLLTFLQNLLTGRISFRGDPTRPITNLIIDIANKGINYFLDWLSAFETTLNGIRSGAGNFLGTIKRIIQVVQRFFLNAAMRDMLISLFNLGVTTVELFVSPGSVNFGSYFNELWKFITKILKVFLQNVGKVMGAILDMMGGAGKFIRTVGGSICGAIQSALCAVTKFLAIKPPLCSLGCFSRHHLRSSMNGTTMFSENHLENVPLLLNQFKWDGTSKCDYLVNNYKEYQWSELRPIEEFALYECLEQKLLALQFTNVTGFPVPEDILYNWKSKYMYAYDVLQFLILYVEQKVGGITVKAMITEMKKKKLYKFLEPFHNIISKIPNVVSHSFVHSFVLDIAKIADENFNPNVNQNTPTHAAYRIYKKASNTVLEVGKILKKEDVYGQMTEAVAAMSSIKAVPKITIPKMPSKIEIVDHKPMKRSYLKTRILKAAGVQSGTTPCEEREKSYVCINCLVIDNALNAFIEAGIELKNYYQYIFMHDTLPTFVNYWRETNVNITITLPTPVAIKFDYIYLAWKMDPLTIQMKQFAMPTFDPNLNLFDPITFDPITLDPITLQPINFEFDPIKMPVFGAFNGFGTPKFDQFGSVQFPEQTQMMVPELDPVTEESLQGNLNQAQTEAKERIRKEFEPNLVEDTINPYKLRSNRSHIHFRLKSTLQNISEYDRAHQDWEWYFTKGFNPFKNYSNDVDVRDGFYDVLFKFLTTTDETYVQYFAHGLPWYIKQPIILECPMKRMYCLESTTSQRLDKITEALWYMLYISAGPFILQYYTQFPIAGLIAPYLLYVFAFIYMYTVYTYTYPCFPSAPQCLFDDMYAYLNDRLLLDCFCSYFPALSNSCVQQTCEMCSRSTIFDTCSDVVELKIELGIFWGPLFYLRKYYPEVILFMYKNIPFSWFLRHWDGYVTVARFIIEEVAITGEENDCLKLAYGDGIFLASIILLGVTVSKYVIPISMHIYQLANELSMLLISTLYSMALAIELQTVSGLE